MEADEVREYAGKNLCEDCYIDAISPAKTCDPWATYTASRLDNQDLTPHQETILTSIDQRGDASPEELMAATGLDEKDLMREIAALRHMELVKATPRPRGQAGVGAL
jgi:predicted transcriptional regulator